MSLFERLKNAAGIRPRAGVTVKTRKLGDRTWQFRVEFTGSTEGSDYVLLGVHYLSHILAHLSAGDPATPAHRDELRRHLTTIVNEGVWPGSDLIRYAGLSDRVTLGEEDPNPPDAELDAALFIPPGADEPDLGFAGPLVLEGAGLVYSAVAVLQAVTRKLDPAGVEHLDRALRYFNSYLDEGASCTDPATARNLANRAVRASA